jgi:argininosuccinate synthase
VDLYKGQIYFTSAENVPHSIYSAEVSSMEKVGSFDHRDSEGFLRILGISAKTIAEKKQIDVDRFM